MSKIWFKEVVKEQNLILRKYLLLKKQRYVLTPLCTVQGAIRTFMLSNDMDIIKVCMCWDFVLVVRSM